MSTLRIAREREVEILELIIESYIEKSKPISSQYLCRKYKLPYSPATVRNIMMNLEKKSFIANLHTSSGRVPTKEGFKYYVCHLKKEDIVEKDCSGFNFSNELAFGVEEYISNTMDALSQMTGYASIVAFPDTLIKIPHEDRFLCRGTRFIFNQPEFEDLGRLKNLFYALEVKIQVLHELMLENINEALKIMVGDEMGVEEVADCSLVVSGSQDEALPFAIGLIGPIRMDYVNAASNLCSVKGKLHDVVKEIIE